jgi:thymidylate synthase ThyX/5-methylcytosine-specific restriction endonuclease McrA
VAYRARVLLDSTSPAGIRLTTLEVTFPRFVLAEFNTHRQFCLDGETRLYFDLPTRSRNKETRRFTLTIRELFDKWHDGAAPRRNRRKTRSSTAVDANREYTARELAAAAGYAGYTGIDLLTRRVGIPRIVSANSPYRVRGAEFIAWAKSEGVNRQGIRGRLAAMELRSCNEDTGEIYHTRIRDVTYSGRKPVFRVTLDTGQAIVCSKEHRLLTREGWRTLEDAVRLALSPGMIATWSKAAEFAVNGIEAYKDPFWLAGMRDVGLSATMIARHCGVSIDRIKYQLKKHGLRVSNPEMVWALSHTEDPWNKGRRYSNLKTRGVPRRARVRKGPESHLWRGGITPQRKRIGAWTVHQAFRVHRANQFKCVLCGSNRQLHTHHVDPVARNPARAFDRTNLTSLCRECHSDLHWRNLELRLLQHVESGQGFDSFWGSVGGLRLRKPYAPKKKWAMVRHFVAVKSVEYVGERDTYDLEVEGPYHNFVADGFIVHNSRNSASSRAIPTAKLIERVQGDPASPLEWGKNKAGMSASEALPSDQADEALRVWLAARDDAVRHAQDLLELNVHKQELNRLLEPFLWHTVIVSATEWANFFNLRCAPNAQPEIRAAALLMREAMDASVPVRIEHGEWHTPLLQPDESGLDLEVRRRVSAARCARVSYLTHEGKRQIERDLELYERLRSDRHLSPFEHVATPAQGLEFHANFRGWLQMRREVEDA